MLDCASDQLTLVTGSTCSGQFGLVQSARCCLGCGVLGPTESCIKWGTQTPTERGTWRGHVKDQSLQGVALSGWAIPTGVTWSACNAVD